MDDINKVFCASPNCVNACGRKMSDEQRLSLGSNAFVSYVYFCREPSRFCGWKKYVSLWNYNGAESNGNEMDVS